MPTPEERLNVVERDLKQFKMETIRVYQDTSMELGIVKGLADSSIGRLRTLSTQVAEVKQDINDRFDWTDQRFDTLNQQVYELGQGIKAVRQDMNGRFETTNQQIAEVRQDMNGRLETLEQRLNGRFEALDAKFDQVLNILTALTTRPDQQAQ